jgi:hypothetical protein
MAATQKPTSQTMLSEKSSPPAWKQLPTWYQVSYNVRIIPPDAERMFAKQMLQQSHFCLAMHHQCLIQVRLRN